MKRKYSQRLNLDKLAAPATQPLAPVEGELVAPGGEAGQPVARPQPIIHQHIHVAPVIYASASAASAASAGSGGAASGCVGCVLLIGIGMALVCGGLVFLAIAGSGP